MLLKKQHCEGQSFQLVNFLIYKMDYVQYSQNYCLYLSPV